VSLTSPNLVNGIHYPNGTSTNPWSTSGGKLHSTSQPTRVDSYHVLLQMTTTPAKELAIDVTYTLHCCFSDRKIGLYVLGSSGSISIPPSPMLHSFRHVTDLTNTSAMKSPGSVRFTTRVYVTVANVQLFIAFRSLGFSGTLENIKAFYFKCPAVVANFVSYPEKIAPTRESVALAVSGTCVHQSLPKTNPSDNVMLCYANGTSKTMGICQCIAGYQNTSMSSCSACPPKTFKSSNGNFNCSICGSNVLDGTPPRRKICQCKSGFFRPLAYVDEHHVNCEEPPSEVTSLIIKAVTSTSVSLTWKKPNKTGTDVDIWYLVRYGAKTVKSYTPYITIVGLTPFIKLNVTISSENNVTGAIGMSKSVVISVTTLRGLPSMVRDLRYVRNDNQSVTVYWTEPTVRGSAVVSYAIGIKKRPLKFLNVTYFTVPQEENKIFYNITVRSHNVIGFSGRQTIEFTIPGKDQSLPNTGKDQGLPNPTTITKVSVSDPDYIAVAVGTSVGLGVPTLFVLLLLYILCKARRKKKMDEAIELQDVGERNPVIQGDEVAEADEGEVGGEAEENDILEEQRNRVDEGRAVEHDEDGVLNLGHDGDQNEGANEAADEYVGPLRAHEEENEYEEIAPLPADPQAQLPEGDYQALNAAAGEAVGANNDYTKLHDALPKHLEGLRRKHMICTYEKNEIDQKLADQLKTFRHQNVLSFTKTIAHENSELALFDKAERGPLDKYLQKKEKKKEYTIELWRMALGVAEGMKYLSGKNYVHKYLKAENILVASDGTCRIFGFNLRKKGAPTSPYRTPQVDLSQTQLTTKSDVWSYGVLLWEIMSYGKAPELTGAKDEYILKKPENCDQELYDLMTSCWKKEPNDRPSFELICTALKRKINLSVNGLTC